jgi:hypothetical protein
MRIALLRKGSDAMPESQVFRKCFGAALALAPLFLYCAGLHAKNQNFDCAFKSRSLSHAMKLTETDDALKRIDYTAVSFTEGGPPFPSCGISATTEGKKAKETTWAKTPTGYLIHFNTFLHEGESDKVLVVKTDTGYTFAFRGVSPLSCGSFQRNRGENYA